MFGGEMKFIKQIITDAKKQKALGTSQNTNQLSDIMIPTIEIFECQPMYFDEKIFEYDMIRRARDAEILLAEILSNCELNFLNICTVSCCLQLS